MPINGKYIEFMNDYTGINGPVEPLEIASVTSLWWSMTLQLLDLLAPFHRRSIFLPSCQKNNLTYIQVAYFSYFQDLYSHYGIVKWIAPNCL